MALEIGNLLEINVLGSIFGQKIVTTFPYVVSEPSTEAVDTIVCKKIADYWQSGAVSPFLSFLACCPQNYTADEISVQKVYPTRFRSMRSPVGLPGTDPNDATSANTAASIERAGEQAGRAFVGRISIPALAPTNQVNGLILNTFLVKMSTLGSKMLNMWSNTTLVDPTLNIKPCLIHRVKNATTHHWEITGFSLLFTTVPQTSVRTQRSRNIGKGI